MHPVGSRSGTMRFALPSVRTVAGTPEGAKVLYYNVLALESEAQCSRRRVRLKRSGRAAAREAGAGRVRRSTRAPRPGTLAGAAATVGGGGSVDGGGGGCVGGIGSGASASTSAGCTSSACP